MSLQTRPSSRGSRSTLNALRNERAGEQFYADGALKPTEVAANQAQAEAIVCERCGKQVHPSNWMKHQNSDHGDDPKPLHESRKDELLPLAAIRTDGGTQPRAMIDENTVADYAESMNEGAKFPAIIVFFDGQDYWLADGFHRVAAAKQLAWQELPADVRQGTQRDAILHSVGVNATHGLRRTNVDKRRAVERLLRDDEWAKWSNREIAKRCAVGEKLVRSLRPSRSDDENDERTYTTKHGTTATMHTANIGKVTQQAEQAFPRQKPPSETTYSKIEDDYQDDVPSVDVEDLDTNLSGEMSAPVSEAQTDAQPVSTGSIEPTTFEIGDEVATTLGREGGKVWNHLPDMGVYVKFEGGPASWFKPEDLVLVRRAEKKSPGELVKQAKAFAHHLSGSNEWYTPAQYILAVRDVLDEIDLDPASCAFANEVVQAKKYFDASVDGLCQPWRGRVFLNPPYGWDEDGESNVALWIRRLLSEFEAKHVKSAVLLVNATTERNWFQPLWQFPICFTDHRINFYNADGEQKQPTQGNAFVYLGDRPHDFAKIFKPFGAIVRRMA